MSHATPTSAVLLQDRGQTVISPALVPHAPTAAQYIRVILWYLLALRLCWAVGIEGIYGSPLPFYALMYPAGKTVWAPLAVPALAGYLFVLARPWLFPERTRGLRPFKRVLAAYTVALIALAGLGMSHASAQWLTTVWRDLRWHVPALGVGTAFFCGFAFALRRTSWFGGELSPRAMAWFLTGLVAFAMLFPACVALIRDGLDGIGHAYARHGYEYAGDVGSTGSIHALFRDYLKVRPHLSMHAKVHPPGPIALLWLMSYVSGQDPFPLSVATVMLGALGVIPLYLLARDLFNKRVGLTCAILYALMPSIVLFTATSADILFLPVSTTALWLFWRAISRPSAPMALAAGMVYAIATLLSFTLISIGAFFAAIGLVFFVEPARRRAVVQTAVLMVAGLFIVHGAVRAWSGFDYVACFHACRAQFNLDQQHLDLVTPRYPWWAWKILNPACWFYFAGIPVSILFLHSLRSAFKGSSFRTPPLIPPQKGKEPVAHPTLDSPGCEPASPEFVSPPDGGVYLEYRILIAVAVAAGVMSLLYLARGEGERSAMYILPLVVIPAGHFLDAAGRVARSTSPLLTAAVFLAVQCWFTETAFYTFW